MAPETDKEASSPSSAAEQPDLMRRLLAALEFSNVTVFTQDRDLRYVSIINPPGKASTDSIVGRTDADLLPGQAGADVTAFKRKVLASGRSARVELCIPGPEATRWYDLNVEPRVDETGAMIGIDGISIDITERRRSAEQLRVLLRELAHRSKNLLAVIQSIAAQTAHGVSSVDEFVFRFSGRLQSLARAHDVLTEGDWRGATFADLARTQVSLYDDWPSSRVSVSGEPLLLNPNAAQHLSLALHELATNAIKYGALSGPAGQVEINWRRELQDGDAASVIFAWKEKGGPCVEQPTSLSFGRLMLEQVVPAAVSGTAALDFEPDGVSYTLKMPENAIR